MACTPPTDNSSSASAMERSACSALNPRDRRNPVRYAVDGYGVLSCVIGGMIDRMRTSLMSGSISCCSALQDRDCDWAVELFIRQVSTDGSRGGVAGGLEYAARHWRKR